MRGSGVDVGDVRIGVATCDPSGMIATPVETVARGAGDLARLRALADELDAVEVVVGLPRSLSGGEGPAPPRCGTFAGQLAAALAADGVAVRLCRRAAQHRVRGGGAARAGAQGKTATCRRGPSGSGGHLAECIWTPSAAPGAYLGRWCPLRETDERSGRVVTRRA